ncbi:hypothetical protein LTR91_015161 [Friedmanniomyces endolithicus]|uniref:Uncharacterized protein n=1 Tax=Friedmanniomyces endolithicus TaxID=329885 RepID=A0AAN6QMJ3_9PEZI|nr:hypothetical protein LTR57_007106 [Friedmanniomyces endolithicus]KAK0972439.1 hypothetical protein LTR91_015161 [Friedmanniomyces endolithicus]KAK0996551.1 hypothetical protein LTS01_006344 [Friedmanniomyces endolithicus]KAK1036889.1 hypothetical protein LTS16_013311 [Friedmanniomyces endolithicus]
MPRQHTESIDMDAEDDVTAFADSGCWSSSEQYEAGLHGIDNFDWGLPSSLAVEEQTGPAMPTVQLTKEGEHHTPILSEEPCTIVDLEAAAHQDEPSVSDGEPMDWESVVPRIRQHTKAELDESSTLTMLSDEGIHPEQEGGEQRAAASDVLSREAHIVETSMNPIETPPEQEGGGQLAVVSSSPSQDAQLAESTMDPVEALPLLGIASLNSSDSFSQPSAVSNATKLEALDRSATTDGGTTTPITTNKHQVGERELKGLDKISPRGKTRRQTKDVVQARPSGAAKRRHQKRK